MVEEVINPRQRVLILDSYSVQLLEIDAQPQISILLLQE
jgi:hypothetical protein